MTPWIESKISASELELFERIRSAVWLLPNLELGKYDDGSAIDLSCHILARAVGQIFNLPVQDGYFYPNCRHSWLLLPSNHIIDVYPVGIIGGPLLVENARGWSPGKWLYRTADTFEVSRHPHFHFGRPCFRRAVLIVFKELKKIQSPG